MKRPCGFCIDGMVWMRTDLSNPDCDNEDWTTCPRCGGTRFVEVDDPYVCHLCGQRLERNGRCNSGYHESPTDDPPNQRKGRAIRLSVSNFTKPWNPDAESCPELRGGTRFVEMEGE